MNAQNGFDVEAAIGKGKCMTFNDAIWKYEFCPMKHVRQARTFVMNEETYTEEYILGRYIPTLSDASPHSNQKTLPSSSTSFTQTYYDGDFCSQNGKEREVQISYFVQPGIAEPQIVSVMEMNLCAYIIRVAIPPPSGEAEIRPTTILCCEDRPLLQTSPVTEETAPKILESGDLIDLRKSVWTQKLKAIVSNSESGFTLLNSALNEINRIEDSIEKSQQSSGFNFQKWIQLLGLEMDKMASSVKDRDEKKKKSDEDED